MRIWEREGLTLRVESLEAETSIRESEDQDTL
jgi:hypothetical protein